MNMSFLNFCALWLHPGLEATSWACRCRSASSGCATATPGVWMLERVAVAGGGRVPPPRRLRRLPPRRRVLARRTSRCAAGSIRDIAAERGKSYFGTLLDIVIADELRTVLWPVPKDDDGASWDLRRQVWNDPRAMIGGSDAGAHLDRMCGAPYTTRFLADCLRGRQLVSLERAVQLITSAPAALFGLRDRGVLREGAIADVVVFDPDDRRLRRRHPRRATSPATPPASPPARSGIVRVLVNGTVIVEDGKATGATPGTVLRSGRDTDTVTAR